MFALNGLAEAGRRLSASRFAGTAAAILEGRQFLPVVAEQQQDFLIPGLRPLQVADEGPSARADLVFLTHGCLSPLKFREGARDASPVRPGQSGQRSVADLPAKPFGKQRLPGMAVEDPDSHAFPRFEGHFEGNPAIGRVTIGGKPGWSLSLLEVGSMSHHRA